MARRLRRSRDRDATDVSSDLSLAPLAVQRALTLSLQDRRQYHPARRLLPVAGIFSGDANDKLRTRRSKNIRRDSARASALFRGAKRKALFRKVRGLSQARRNALERRFRDVLAVAVPRRVALCVRRKSRREVLFARRLTGRGARSRKRFSDYSLVRC